MHLIPNYCPYFTTIESVDSSFIFDYRGRPYGFDTSFATPELTNEYADKWVNFIGKRPGFQPVFPHSRM